MQDTMKRKSADIHLVCVLMLVLFSMIHKSCATNVFNSAIHKDNGITATPTQISWLQQWKLLRRQMKSCVKYTQMTTFDCFKNSSLVIFEEILSANVIPIWHGVRLVRTENSDNPEKYFKKQQAKMDSTEKPMSDVYQRNDLQHLTWFDRLAMSLAKTLKTHMLQINLKQLSEAYVKIIEKNENVQHMNSTDAIGTARHRRQRFNMMITMMFGVTALGAVLVPLGFQMLSIVSGKALLLAKMALLLASINGLKRVANSGLHYGLYHVPGEHYGGFYERGDASAHHPRNILHLAITEPAII